MAFQIHRHLNLSLPIIRVKLSRTGVNLVIQDFNTQGLPRCGSLHSDCPHEVLSRTAVLDQTKFVLLIKVYHFSDGQAHPDGSVPRHHDRPSRLHGPRGGPRILMTN